MKKIKRQKPLRSEQAISRIFHDLNFYVLSATERMTQRTGLSEGFCRRIVENDLVSRKERRISHEAQYKV